MFFVGERGGIVLCREGFCVVVFGESAVDEFGHMVGVAIAEVIGVCAANLG